MTNQSPSINSLQAQYPIFDESQPQTVALSQIQPFNFNEPDQSRNVKRKRGAKQDQHASQKSKKNENNLIEKIECLGEQIKKLKLNESSSLLNLIGEVKNESKQQMVDLKEIFESNQKLKLSHAVLEEENRSLRAQMNFINEQYVHSSYLTSQEANQLHVAVEQPANHLPSSQQAVDTGQDPDKIGVDLIDSIIQLEHQLRQVTKNQENGFSKHLSKIRELAVQLQFQTESSRMAIKELSLANHNLLTGSRVHQLHAKVEDLEKENEKLKYYLFAFQRANELNHQINMNNIAQFERMKQIDSAQIRQYMVKFIYPQPSERFGLTYFPQFRNPNQLGDV